jgi:hypothetical protein
MMHLGTIRIREEQIKIVQQRFIELVELLVCVCVCVQHSRSMLVRTLSVYI